MEEVSKRGNRIQALTLDSAKAAEYEFVALKAQ